VVAKITGGTMRKILKSYFGVRSNHLLEITDYHQGEVLLCPVCGRGDTHFDSAFELEGMDEKSLKPQLPIVGESGSRRNAQGFKFYGECGHWFEVVFTQHKGTTYLHTNVLEERRGCPYDRRNVCRRKL
jgi:hypothetical protein